MKIQIEGLSKSYRNGYKALKNIDINIGVGMFGLLGPNGAGKSTFMQILATIMPPTAGKVEIDSYLLGRDNHQIRQILGYLPQTPGLYEKLTGEEFLHYVALLKGLKSSKERRITVGALLEKVNMTKHAKNKIKAYSGGMKQRIGIAQALLGDPKLLIVDEPTAGLDPEERIRFRELLEELGLERTILLSTHIVADIESSCKELAVMNNGSILFQGTIDMLLELVKDKVWSGKTDSNEFHLPSSMHVESIMVGKRRLAFEYDIRMVSSHRPFNGAELVTPTIEDAYLYLTRSENHE